MGFILLFLLFSLSAVSLIFIHRGLPGSAKDIGWKMSGVWCNPNNLHVLLHSNGRFMRGHVVTTVYENGLHADSALVIKELAVKPLWRWSEGTYVEPVTRREHPVKMRLSGTRTIFIKFLDEQKTEEWKLIDPL
jgi:hypothetical protein